ncbi:hypothetical protein [Streptomyces demainii]|uniref:DUF2637 domain-containing protein n=1 Tax=Streptomyces demainii TaxID=588122 RepID=A0ABT9KK95_9ACTN|nr:hypothetical protein [Streptomyces demainii]MDP9608853.1 hypothetical protein [Streptomyces demainii]
MAATETAGTADGQEHAAVEPGERRTLGWPELRPYIPSRSVLRQVGVVLGTGSLALLKLGAAKGWAGVCWGCRALVAGISRGWAWAAEDWGPRLGGVALGGYVAVYLTAHNAAAVDLSVSIDLGPYLPYLVLVVPTAWGLAAWYHSPAVAERRQNAKEPNTAADVAEDADEDQEHDDVEAEAEADESLSPAELLGLLEEGTGTAGGVHLADVVTALHGQLDEKELRRRVADLRPDVEALGLPIEPQLKLRGRNKIGVRREALERVLGRPVGETAGTPAQAPESASAGGPAEGRASPTVNGPVSTTAEATS